MGSALATVLLGQRYPLGNSLFWGETVPVSHSAGWIHESGRRMPRSVAGDESAMIAELKYPGLEPMNWKKTLEQMESLLDESEQASDVPGHGSQKDNNTSDSLRSDHKFQAGIWLM